MRKIFIATSSALLLLVSPGRGQPQGAFRANMTCERMDAPGRMRCEVEARVGSSETIATGDVIIVRTPRFVMALRGRIGPNEATTREAELWRWAFALAAQEKGIGDIEATARLIVCRGGTCEPRQAHVQARVVVGQ